MSTIESTAIKAQKCAFESLKLHENPINQQARQVLPLWQCPVGDTLKINVDGAFHDATKSGSWGFVVRNRTGAVRGAGA